MSIAKLGKNKISKICQYLIIFLIIAGWIFSGWPRIWQKPPIPPEIQVAQAATYTETYTTAGNFTWTAPPGIATTTVEAWGGGGGGGVQANQGGGGGGGGAYAQSVVNVTPGTNYAITVGAGGVSDSLVGGGDSTFATTTVVADGGLGSDGAAAAGTGGTTTNSTGDVKFAGGNGAIGLGTDDTGGGGGGAGGPAGAGNNGTAGTATVGGVGGSGNAGSGGAGGTSGNASAGGAGGANATGGGGGGGGDNTFKGGNGGAPGGGAGGGEVGPNTGAAGQIKLTYTIFTVLGNAASEPSNATIGPGGSITDLDNFTFQNTTSTDTVTALVVTLGPAGAYNNISQVDITDTSNVAKCTAVAGLTSNTVTFSSCTISVTTTETTYKIRITPKSHASMPPPSSGASYDTTGTVTSYTSTNVQTGSDTGSATITVDNLSPNGATATSTSAGDAQVTLNWTTSNSSDFSRSVVLRWTGASPGSEVPAEGTDYSVDNTITTATVACVRTTDATSTAVSGTDGAGTGGCSAVALTNGQTYSYKVFQKDSNGNYDIGVSMGSATPTAAEPTISCDSYPVSGTDFDTLTSGNVATSTPNASTTMSCSNTSSKGCTLYVKSAGGGGNPGLWNSSASYLIPSPNAAYNATATLEAGIEGYGIQATTTASGLSIAARYLQIGDTVGGLATSTLVGLTLASSTADIANAETIITHKAAISQSTLFGSYADTITYSCLVNN